MIKGASFWSRIFAPFSWTRGSVDDGLNALASGDELMGKNSQNGLKSLYEIFYKSLASTGEVLKEAVSKPSVGSSFLNRKYSVIQFFLLLL